MVSKFSIIHGNNNAAAAEWPSPTFPFIEAIQTSAPAPQDQASYHLLPIKGAYDNSQLIAALATLAYRYTAQAKFALAFNCIEKHNSMRSANIQCEVDCNETLHSIAQTIAQKSKNTPALNEKTQGAQSALGFLSITNSLAQEIQSDTSTTNSYITRSLNKTLYLNQPIPLCVVHVNDELSLLALNKHTFEINAARQIHEHIEKILTFFIKDEALQAISHLPILSAQQIEIFETQWQGHAVSFEQMHIYQHIELHSQNTPDAIALEFKTLQLSYNELNKKTNQLARHLLAQSLGRGDHVAVLLDPSVEIIITLIALWKIGAVYVPVDPIFPQKRIDDILEEVAPNIILVHQNGRNNIASHYKQLALAFDDEKLNQYDTSNLDLDISVNDASHIYFTSGTTGKPKGIVATHLNLNHYLKVAKEQYKFDQSDRRLACARFTFSISMFELASPLLAGGTLRLIPREDLLQLDVLVKHLQWANSFLIGPSLLKRLLPYIQSNFDTLEPFEHVKHSSTGGDMVPPDLLESLKTVFPKAEIYVIYGSSEISCMGCAYLVPRDRHISKTLVGKPHANTLLRIEDMHGNLVPPGVKGRLAFGGDGIVRGYLNLEELTKEKFFNLNKQRYYRIGDVGRYDFDGNVELLGREDFQIKIRGIRIELAEVDHFLRKIPLVEDAISNSVIANDGEPMIVGYLVAAEGKQLNLSEIYTFLSQHLPDFMIPLRFVVMDALPVNLNNKLDRGTLPKPSKENTLSDSAGSKDSYSPPETDLQRQLINTWQEALEIQIPISIDSTFYELGGHSLLALKIIQKTEIETGKHLPFDTFIHSPTIRKMADILSQDKQAEASGAIILKHGQTLPLHCLYGVLLYQPLALSLSDAQSVVANYVDEETQVLTEREDQDSSALYSSMENIVDKYYQLMLLTQAQGPYYLAGLSFGGIVALEVARKLKENGHQVPLVTLIDSWHPSLNMRQPAYKRLFAHLGQFIRAPKQYSLDKFQKLRERLQTSPPKSKATAMQDDDLLDVNDIRSRARTEVLKQFDPQPYDGKVIIYRALDKGPFLPNDATLGWSETLSDLEVVDINCDHLGILEPPHVTILAKHLEQYLPKIPLL